MVHITLFLLGLISVNHANPSSDRCAATLDQADFIEHLLSETNYDAQLDEGLAYVRKLHRECAEGYDRLPPTLVRQAGKLLEIPGLRLEVSLLLYRWGAVARPALPLVQEASRDSQKAVARLISETGVGTGPLISVDRSLRCLGIRLRSGRKDKDLCRTLDYLSEHPR